MYVNEVNEKIEDLQKNIKNKTQKEIENIKSEIIKDIENFSKIYGQYIK